MNRIRKLAAVVKEGVSNPEKIKKGLKVLKKLSTSYVLKRIFLLTLTVKIALLVNAEDIVWVGQR